MEGWREKWREGRDEGMTEGGGRWLPFVAVGALLIVVVVLIFRHRRVSSSCSNVICHRHSLLVVGSVRRLRAVVAVFDLVWWWGRCLRLWTPGVVHGWLGWALLIAGGLSWVVGSRSVVVLGFAVRS